MSEVVRFELADGSSVLVEVDEDDFGIERASRGADDVIASGRMFTEALASVSDAAQASLEVLRRLRPDRLELNFGVKLSGEAGAIIARTAGEGHFAVTVNWTQDQRPSPAPSD